MSSREGQSISDPSKLRALLGEPGALPGQKGWLMPSPFQFQPQHFNTSGLARTEQLERRAHFIRFHPTPSEARLWSAIRSRQLRVQFRRQVVIGDTIVDFAAPSVHLVLEVDGDTYPAERAEVDARRTLKLGTRTLAHGARGVWVKGYQGSQILDGVC